MATDPTTNLTYGTDFFSTTLTSSITATDTTIPLDNVPTETEGYLVLESTSSTNREVIFYNAVGASSVTVPSTADRGLGGTTAQAHTAGATVERNVTAQDFEAIRTAKNLADSSITPRKIDSPYLISVITGASVGAPGSTAYANIPSVTRSITVAVTSTIVCAVRVVAQNNSATAILYGRVTDGTRNSTVTSIRIDTLSVNTPLNGICVLTGVPAGTHTLQLQFASDSTATFTQPTGQNNFFEVINVMSEA